MPATIPDEVRQDISFHLDAIRAHFKALKLTLLVRAPELKDADLLVSDDLINEAVAALLRLKHAGKVVPPDPASHGPRVPPLTEGAVRKGGINRIPENSMERPPPPAPIGKRGDA